MEDPFIINSCPHVYFAGNQEFYEEKLIIEKADKQGKSKVNIGQ